MAIARPTKFPDWARVNYVDPVVGGDNVVEPSEQKKDDGWLRYEKPPANIQNWLHKITNDWLTYLDSIATNATFKTADIKFTGRVVVDPGWIMYTVDGTIGSATSSATIFANEETEDLFLYYHDNYSDAVCPVDGGRGASAAADWAANKRIHPPKYYDRVLGAAGASYPATTSVGETEHTLTVAQLAPHTHGYTRADFISNGGEGVFGIKSQSTPQTGSTGGGDPHNNMQPTYFINIMVKL